MCSLLGIKRGPCRNACQRPTHSLSVRCPPRPLNQIGSRTTPLIGRSAMRGVDAKLGPTKQLLRHHCICTNSRSTSNRLLSEVLGLGIRISPISDNSGSSCPLKIPQITPRRSLEPLRHESQPQTVPTQNSLRSSLPVGSIQHHGCLATCTQAGLGRRSSSPGPCLGPPPPALPQDGAAAPPQSHRVQSGNHGS
jgi:hypothetical protein